MEKQHELPFWFTQNAEARLRLLYGDPNTPDLMNRLIDKTLAFIEKYPPTPKEQWSEQDAILITYGDSVTQPGQSPLTTMHEFIELHLIDAVNAIHILPFFPYSSDDGFAVIDYREVNSKLGEWRDIERIAKDFGLMTDLVINHVSSESAWFKKYLADENPESNYFIEADPDADYSQVMRPRTSPLLTEIKTGQKKRHVWTTFSADQIDLDFGNPDVLFEMIDILLLYISKGSRFIRLDAVAFLWKKSETRCIHLRETHEIVKLFRDIINVAAPGTLLITETNVPHWENLSYFGVSDEAHMVYQFALPPLLLHSLFQGDATHLTEWAMTITRPPKRCTFFNFIASHDGIGLRPIEGMLPEQEIQELVEAMRGRGGFVSMKANEDGSETPYEINISLFNALGTTHTGETAYRAQRFICAHAIMLALQGIPGVYIHSFFATPNDIKGVNQTGQSRSINRRRWNYQELLSLLTDETTPHAKLFAQQKQLLVTRRRQPAFHPEADQKTLPVNNPCVFAFWRTSMDKLQNILVIANCSEKTQAFELPPRASNHGYRIWRDLIAHRIVESSTETIRLAPYQTVWLEALD